jgi:DHA1 family multidrug resistance protein-like MFS transporter
MLQLFIDWNTYMNSNTRRYILLFVAFLYWLSLFFYIPILPVHVQERVSSLSELGFVLSMYGFWQMVSRFPIGIIADRLGWRKPLAVAMLVLLSAGSLVLGLGTDFWGLTVGRSMIGFAAAAWVLLIVLYTSEVEPARLLQSTAQMTIIFAAGRVTASLICPWLVSMFGQSMPFWLSSGVALLAAVILLFTPLKALPRVKVSFQSIKRIIFQPGVLLPSFLSIILHYADWAATFSFIPIQAKTFGASASTLSFLVILELLIIVPANTITPSLVKKYGKIPVIVVSIGCQALAMFLIYYANGLSWLWVAQGFLGIGYGLAYPILLGMVMECTQPTEHSIATGFHQSAYALGMFAGPSISGIIAASVGVQPAFAVTGFIVLAGGIIGTIALKRFGNMFLNSAL